MNAIGLPESLEDAVPASLLKAEVTAWARRMSVSPREVHVRPMTTKWASCSSRGRLTFDTDLLKQPAAFRSEVIAHELLHLKVPNHGRVFTALLKAYLARVPAGRTTTATVRLSDRATGEAPITERRKL